MRPALLLLLLLLALLSSARAQEPPPEEGVMLHMIEYSYAPDPLNVTAGETIIVMNFGPADQSLPQEQWGEFTHSVTAVDGSFDMQNIPPDFQGRTFLAPSAPGSYPYYCRYHGDATSGMRGTLVVAAVAETAPEVGDKGIPLVLLPLLAGAALAVCVRGRGPL